MNNIKKYFFSALFYFIFTTIGQSQEIKTAYFIENTPLRISMNPAFRPAYGYFNIPAIGNLGVNVHSALSLDQLLFPRNGKLVTFLDPLVSTEDFLRGLKKNNRFNLDAKISLLGFGFYTKKIYWTFGLNINVNTIINLPRDLLEFAKKGTDVDGSSFDIKNTNLNTNAYSEASLGFSVPIGDMFTIGFNMKFLIGIGNINIKMNELNINANADKWEINRDGLVTTNMSILFIDENGSVKYDLDKIGFTGMGAAFDIGLTARPIEGLLVSAAVTDLGFISWNEKNNITAEMKNSFLFDGFKLPSNDTDLSIKDQLDQTIEDLKALTETEKKEQKSNTQMIIAKFNIGAEYSILKDKIGFGLLYTGKISPFTYEHELTALTTFRPKHWFSTAFSYSFLNNNYNSFGFVLNFSPTWINFFIGTDYFFTKITPRYPIPYDQNNINVYLGISIPLGVKKAKMANNASRINKSIYDL